MKKAFIFFALCLALPALASEVVGKIVALVDDKVITLSDIEEARQQNSRLRALSVSSVLWELINEKVMEGEFDREKIDVPEDEIDRTIQGIITQNGVTIEKLQDEMIKRGLSMASYRDNIKNDLARTQFFQKVIYPRIRISDVDLQEYYKRNAKQYSGYEKIRFLEILLTPDSYPPGVDLEAESRKLAGQLRKGGGFSEAARKYSRGGFASNGGDSGLIAAKDLRPDLLEVLMKLKLNTVSDPIPTSEGFFIFKIVEATTPKQRSYMEVKESLRQTYLSERMKDELDSYIVEARSRHHIEIR